MEQPFCDARSHKNGAGGFPRLRWRGGRCLVFLGRAIDCGEMGHLSALSTFGAPRICNCNIGKNIGF